MERTTTKQKRFDRTRFLDDGRRTTRSRRPQDSQFAETNKYRRNTVRIFRRGKLLSTDSPIERQRSSFFLFDLFDIDGRQKRKKRRVCADTSRTRPLIGRRGSDGQSRAAPCVPVRERPLAGYRPTFPSRPLHILLAVAPARFLQTHRRGFACNWTQRHHTPGV